MKKQASDFTLIHPQQEYELHMSSLRKKYFKEHQELLQQKAQVQADQKIKELKAREARLKDIQSYKAEQEAEFSSYEVSVTFKEEKQKEEPQATSSAAEPQKEPYHKVFQMTESQLAQFYKKRTSSRRNHYNNRLIRKQNKATESLLYLYNEASDFVTYRNMDDKIDQVVTGTPESLGPSIQDLVNKTLRDTSPQIEKKLSERQQAVKDAIFGTLYGKTALSTVNKLADLPNDEWEIEAAQYRVSSKEPKKQEYTTQGLLSRLKEPNFDEPRKMNWDMS